MSTESSSQLGSSDLAPGDELPTLYFSPRPREGEVIFDAEQPQTEACDVEVLLPAVDLVDRYYLPLAYEEEAYPEPTRSDRTDDAGQVIGYSLITVYPWGSKSQEDYDLDDNLIASSYNDDSGNASSSTWETIFDDNGEAAGQRYSYKSSSGSYNYSSVDIYALDGTLISSDSSSSEGDWSKTERVDPPAGLEVGPIPLSHALQTTGAWADGTTYEMTQIFNQDGELVSSESHYSDGSSDQYLVSPQYAEDGTLIGYEGQWTWTDANGEVSKSDWTQEFDAEMNAIRDFAYRGGVHTMHMDLLGVATKASTGEADAGDCVTSNEEDIRLKAYPHSGITHAILRGREDLNLWGNDLRNSLDGNAGDNRIYGGLSRDVLSGGRGDDDFIFRAVRKSRDTITDFDPSHDQLVLKGEEFSSLFRQGSLRSGVIGRVLIFDAQTDKLLFAPQGEREGERLIALAVLPDLHRSDLQRDLFVQA